MGQLASVTLPLLHHQVLLGKEGSSAIAQLSQNAPVGCAVSVTINKGSGGHGEISAKLATTKPLAHQSTDTKVRNALIVNQKPYNGSATTVAKLALGTSSRSPVTTATAAVATMAATASWICFLQADRGLPAYEQEDERLSYPTAAAATYSNVADFEAGGDEGFLSLCLDDSLFDVINV